MGKTDRLEYNTVKNYIEVESNSGCILISENYINSHTKLQIQCKCGEIFFTTFSNFKGNKRKRKRWCNKCGYGLITLQKTKYTYEDAVKIFHNNGFILEDQKDVFHDARTRLKYKCMVCGHQSKASTSAVVHGIGCEKCQRKISSDAQRHSLEEVEMMFSSNGFILLDKEYKRSHGKLNCICPCGNQCQMSFKSVQLGHKCKKCAAINKGSAKRLTYEYVFNYFQSQGCKLLSPTYKNSNEKLQYQCSCGGIDVIDYEHFVRGHRCKHCRKERRQNAMMDNSGVTTSVAQKYLHQVFGGILNHNVAPFFLDIGFPESMIYIEYDGSGHDLCVKLNEISHEEFRKMELKRYFVLKNKGWKMIKFIAPNDYLPSVEVLLKEYNKALDWLSINEKNHSHYVVTFAGKTIDKKYGTMYRITGKEGLKYLNN